MDEPMWTGDWPTAPGWYWHYGWRSDFERRSYPAALRPVQVRRISNGWMYVMEGHLMERSGQGVWLPIELPTPPDSLV